MFRYVELLRLLKVVWCDAWIEHVEENVASASHEAVLDANSLLGSAPWQLNASMAS